DVTGDHDHRNVRMAAADGAKEVGGFDAGDVDIGQEKLDLRAFKDAIGRVGVGGGADVVAFAGKELGEGLEDDAVFVEDEQAGFMGLGGVKRGGGGEGLYGLWGFG